VQNITYGVSQDTDAAAQLRRESLEELSQRDKTISDFQIKKQESIGIELLEILRNPGSEFDIILQEGDIISIPKQLQTVRLRGELLYPITVRHDNSFTFKDYISHAGGFTDIARPGKSYIVYANGSAQRTNKFLWFKNYPQVEPGAEIFVPSKTINVQSISVERILAITSSVLTMLFVIDRLAP
jgi:protein involved in polysaccharide export with SLBB domain